MIETSKTQITSAEFYQLPETNTPVELINGEVIVSPSPVPLYQDIVLNLAVLLKQRSKELGGHVYIAPMDTELDYKNVPQPDLLYIALESQCVVTEKRLVGPPDLIIEVISAGSAKRDRSTKFRLYERSGVREYWIVEPRDKTVEVWQQLDKRFELLDVYGEEETFVSHLLGEIMTTPIFESN